MRRNIYDILNDNNIDLSGEYSRIFNLFYVKPITSFIGDVTVYELVSEHFCLLNKKLVGRCLSVEDFDNTYGFRFEEYPSGFDIDYLISFAEYVLNFVIAIVNMGTPAVVNIGELFKIKQHIDSCIDEIGYKCIEKESIYIIVEKNAAALAVAESVKKDLAYPVLEYNHHKLKGDLSAKKNILKNMADDIEPERAKLNSLNKRFTSDLFQLFNVFIRHNNFKNDYISKMSTCELEKIYDEIYQMWLLAKMQLEYSSEAGYIKEVISNLN